MQRTSSTIQGFDFDSIRLDFMKQIAICIWFEFCFVFLFLADPFETVSEHKLFIVNGSFNNLSTIKIDPIAFCGQV